MKYESTRQRPSATRLEWRKGILDRYLQRSVIEASGDMVPRLSPGNSKTGQTGRLFDTVYVWNLPPAAACPGASAWCLTHCYNADERATVFPIQEWQRNWAWVQQRPNIVAKAIMEQLLSATGRIAVRIHSSGDFYSREYVRLWIQIAAECPDVHFWAYTRSWTIENILPALEMLRLMPNVQLFASVDSTMSAPPSNWRHSSVLDDWDQEACVGSSAIDRIQVTCPEQLGRVPNCASCGYCITTRSGDIVFLLH